VRTEFVTRFAPDQPPFARITVRYGRDPRLGAWVPIEMKENYSFYGIRLECLARYANYRRFETGARIVPQSPS
jgi:hypothetical protein